MLGSNLGKKVTAGVVQDEYKQFLKNKPDEKKKVLTAEERKQAKRVEMRKRGIFVKADDPDESPTVMEKADGPPGHPMLYVLPEKPTMWKRTKKTPTEARKHKKTSVKRKESSAKHKSAKDHQNQKVDSQNETSGTKKKVKTKKTTSSKNVAVVVAPTVTPTPETPMAVPLVIPATAEAVKAMPVGSAEKIDKPGIVMVPGTPQPNNQPLIETPPEKPDEPLKPVVKVKEEAKEPSPPLPIASEDVAAKSPSQSIRSGDGQKANNSGTTSLRGVSSNPSITEMKVAIPLAEKQTDAFEKLDDDEFEKMTSDADEKDMLKLAPRLLKVAKKHAAIEKCLTAEENEVLAKFFSGKQKLDANVLAVLDSALDKIIDYLQKNNCAVDEETKAVMKKRDKLKAAMMEEFLVSPQYLPKTWTAKFNEWKAEAEKQKNGINWFRILLSYPKHKSFDDGPEDTFGNFNRRHRGLLMGLLLGPRDVKSFEETKREDDCQGMFLDTRIIEKAADNTVSVCHSVTTASAGTDRRK